MLCDVHALGVIAYELLAGRLPHELGDLPLPAALRLISEVDPPPLGAHDRGLAGDLQTIVAKTLDKEPERRYASAAALAADLRCFLALRPILARPASRAYRARKFVRRHKGLVASTAAAFLALFAGAVVSLVFALGERDQRQEADRQTAAAEDAARRLTRSLLLSAQRSLELGDVWGAGLSHRMVPREERGWEWSYLASRAPYVVPYRFESYSRDFVDGGRALLFGDGELRLWDLAAERWLGPPVAGVHAHLISNVVGSRVAVNDRTAKGIALLDLEEGRRLLFHQLSPFGHDFHAYRMALHPDGGTFAFSRIGPVVVRRDSGPGWTLPLPAFEPVPGQRGPEFRCLAFRPDGRHLAAIACDTAQGCVIVADVATGREAARRWLQWPRNPRRDGMVAYHPSRAELAVGGQGGAVLLLDADTLETLRVLRPPGQGVRGVAGLAYSPDGEYLAATSEVVRLWRLDSGDLVAEHAIGREATEIDDRTICFSPDSRSMLVPGPDGFPTLLPVGETRAARFRELAGHSSWIDQLAVASDGGLIASSAPLDPLLRIWDPLDGELLAELERAPGERNRSGFLAFRDDGLALVSVVSTGDGEGWELLRWDLATGERTRVGEPRRGLPIDLLDPFLREVRRAEPVRLGPRSLFAGASLGLLTLDGDASFRESFSERPFARAAGPEWADAVRLPAEGLGLALHPGGRHAAVASLAGVRVVDLESGTLVESGDAEERLPGTALTTFYGGYCSAAYSSDGSRLAVGSGTATLTLLETTGYEVVLRQEIVDWQRIRGGETPYLHAIVWAPDDSWLATGSGDGVLRLWDGEEPARRRERLAEAASRRAAVGERLAELTAELGDGGRAARALLEDAGTGLQERVALRRLLIEGWSAK